MPPESRPVNGLINGGDAPDSKGFSSLHAHPKMKVQVLLSALLVAPLVGQSVDFKTEVLPIFESKCFRCHGNGEAKGSLSLDPDDIKKHIRASGQINPGNGGRSVLVERLVTTDSDDKMPRNGSLTEPQIELIKKWIDEGAKLGDDEPTEGGKPAAMAKPEPVKGSWTNNAGVTIEATLIRVDGDNAVLVLADGRSVPYPIANLSAESQAKVNAFKEATLKASQ